MKANDLRVKKKEYIDKDIKEWDAKQWTEEVNSKSSLQLYQAGKRHIKEDTTYDDTPESTILFQARTNSLPLEDRKRHSKEETRGVARISSRRGPNLQGPKVNPLKI